MLKHQESMYFSLKTNLSSSTTFCPQLNGANDGYGELHLHLKDRFQLLKFGFAFFNFRIIILP